MLVIGNPLGAGGVAAEAAIARLCLHGLPALELFERAAARVPVPPSSIPKPVHSSVCGSTDFQHPAV